MNPLIKKCESRSPHGHTCDLMAGHDGNHDRHGLQWIDFKEVPVAAPKNIVDETIAVRGKVYGDPKLAHTNIGLSWTGLIQQHFGIILDHPIPPELVAMMMVNFKMQRSARVYHEDNFIDAKAYTQFAEMFQKPTE